MPALTVKIHYTNAFTGGTKIGASESALLQKVLKNASEDYSDILELLKKNVTYEELEILLGRDQNTRYLSDKLNEKLQESEYNIM